MTIVKACLMAVLWGLDALLSKVMKSSGAAFRNAPKAVTVDQKHLSGSRLIVKFFFVI
jgi:hypothetical protein